MRTARAAPACTLALLAGLAAGCGSKADDVTGSPDAGSPGPRVVLGTGRDSFEALGDDGRVPLIKGIQGGFHVWTSFLAYGFDADVLRMELTTRWEEFDGSVLEMAGNVAVRPALDAEGTPVLLSLGWPASIFNPTCANDRRLAFDLTVRDTSSGLSARDGREWIVEVAAADRSSDCAE